MEKLSVKMGDIFLCNLGEINSTHVQCGVRPVVIVSNNLHNINGVTVNVIPLTSQEKKYMPTHIKLRPNETNGLKNVSWVLTEQQNTVYKNTLISKVGSLNKEELLKVSKGMLLQMPLIAQAVLNGYTETYNYRKVLNI